MAKQMTMILDKILIELPDQEEKTKSGLYVPQTHPQDVPQKGVILALGPDVDTKLGGDFLSVGDTVFFKKHSGDSIDLDNPRLMVIDTFDLLAYIKGGSR